MKFHMAVGQVDFGVPPECGPRQSSAVDTRRAAGSRRRRNWRGNSHNIAGLYNADNVLPLHVIRVAIGRRRSSRCRHQKGAHSDGREYPHQSISIHDLPLFASLMGMPTMLLPLRAIGPNLAPHPKWKVGTIQKRRPIGANFGGNLAVEKHSSGPLQFEH